MDDILEQLNTCIKNNNPIINDGSNIIFGDKQYPISDQVKFQSSTLTLGQVWICLKCINDEYSIYLKQCKEANLNPVNIGIKNLLKGYFNVQDTSLFKSSTTGEAKQTKRKREVESTFAEDDKKRLKPFDYTKVTIPEKEFGEKEQESKTEFIKFLSNSLSDDISNVNTEAFLPYLEFDRPQVLNYINNKEIPFSTRITQTQIEREFVDKKGSDNTKQHSYFSSYLENIKRCKTHFSQHKKDEKQKRIEREQLAKQQGYNQENAKLNLKIKGTFNERNLWNSEFGNEDIMNEIQIDTTGSMMTKTDTPADTFAPSNSNATTSTNSTSIEEVIKKPLIQNAPKQAKKPLPIILLPPGRSSLLSLYNVKDFLQRGAFTTTDDKKKDIDPTTPKPKEVIIKHTKTGTQYLVLDTTKNLHKSDWDRVVAIFTIGQLWQFKDSNNWFSTDPSVIFSKKRGFTLAYEGEALPPNTQNWNVEKLYISRLDSKRHTDSTVSRKFWNSLGME